MWRIKFATHADFRHYLVHRIFVLTCFARAYEVVLMHSFSVLWMYKGGYFQLRY